MSDLNQRMKKTVNLRVLSRVLVLKYWLFLASAANQYTAFGLDLLPASLPLGSQYNMYITGNKKFLNFLCVS